MIKATGIKFENYDGTKGSLTNIDTANIRHINTEYVDSDYVESLNVIATTYKIQDSQSTTIYDCFQCTDGKLISILPVDVDYIITPKIQGTGTLNFSGFSEVSFGAIPVTGTSIAGSGGGSSPWVYNTPLALYSINSAIRIEGGTDVVINDGEILATLLNVANVEADEYKIRLPDQSYKNMFQTSGDGLDL